MPLKSVVFLILWWWPYHCLLKTILVLSNIKKDCSLIFFTIPIIFKIISSNEKIFNIRFNYIFLKGQSCCKKECLCVQIWYRNNLLKASVSLVKIRYWISSWLLEIYNRFKIIIVLYCIYYKNLNSLEEIRFFWKISSEYLFSSLNVGFGSICFYPSHRCKFQKFVNYFMFKLGLDGHERKLHPLLSLSSRYVLL